MFFQLMDAVVKKNHATELMAYLYKMFQEECLTDMQVLGSDGRVYNVHRVVLTASSQYIQKLVGRKERNLSINLGMVMKSHT